MNRSSEAFWRQWEKTRRAELRAYGLSRSDAKTTARFERDRRVKARGLIGDEAAGSAELHLDIRADGSFGASVKVEESQIPTALLPRARAWAGPPHPQRH